MKGWEGSSQPTAEQDMCQFEDADSSSADFPLCLEWNFSKCTRSLWDEDGSVQVEKMIIVLLYLFGEDVQQFSDSTAHLIGNSNSSW